MKNIINKRSEFASIRTSRSGFAQIALIVIGVVVVVGAVVWTIATNNSKSTSEDAMMQEKTVEVMMEGEKASSSEGIMEQKKEGETMEKTENSEAMMEKPGEYKEYSVAAVSAAQATGNNVVLFFHATWCPFCKAANTEFTSRASEIPSGVTVLKTDYDSQTALKQKYGVTYQHTFVQIDASGNQISKWTGGDIENLKKYVK